MSEHRVVVVGAGLAGLAAARRLVDAGVDTIVIESERRVGGVVGTDEVDGFVQERAASSFLGHSEDGALALCRELKVAVESASAAARSRWVYIDGTLRRMPRNPLELLTTNLLTWRGKLDLLREPFHPGRDAAHAGDESVHAFAARRLGPEAARSMIAPLVTGVFAADSHAISLAAGFPVLASLDADGGLVRGSLRQALRRLAGVNAATKARSRGLWAPAGGMQSLIDALRVSLGDRIQMGVTARAMRPSRDGVDISTDGDRLRARGAVLAVPARTAAELVAGVDPPLAARLTTISRAPAVLVYLGYQLGDVARVRDGFGMLVAQGESPRVLGVVFESTVWPGRAPPGQALLRCIYGGARDPSAIHLSDVDLIAQARRDLEQTLGVVAAPTHTGVVRWPAGIAQYPVGHGDRIRELDGRVRSDRVVLAGADYHGVGLNDIIADARRVVREVAGWR